MAQKQTIDAMWDDSPIDVSTEVNFIWSIANKLRGTYQSDKYKDVIIPMVIIRRFECALEPTKDKVVAQFKANPNYPAKAMYRISGFQFYNTSEFTLAELINDADNLAANFKAYLQSFSPNVQEIIVSAEKGLDFYKQIDKMDKNDRLLSVVKAFSELDLNPRTIDNVKMGYIFEDLIRRFSENAEAGDHYTGRDIIKLMVNILLAEGCDDIFDDGKVITVLDQACGTGGMLSTSYNFIKRYNPTADVRLFGQEINPESYAICLAEMLIKGQNAENICYSHTTQSQFDKHTIHSNNLYQIFTYVKNRSYQFGEEKNTVSGMLLYAKTEEEIQPDNVYQMHGSQISVKTLDLNQPFAEIANQMDRIVESHFSGLAKKY